MSSKKSTASKKNIPPVETQQKDLLIKIKDYISENNLDKLIPNLDKLRKISSWEIDLEYEILALIKEFTILEAQIKEQSISDYSISGSKNAIVNKGLNIVKKIELNRKENQKQKVLLQELVIKKEALEEKRRRLLIKRLVFPISILLLLCITLLVQYFLIDSINSLSMGFFTAVSISLAIGALFLQSSNDYSLEELYPGLEVKEKNSNETPETPLPSQETKVNSSNTKAEILDELKKLMSENEKLTNRITSDYNLSKHFLKIEKRISDAIKNLNNKANFNLLIGLGTTIGAVFILIWTAIFENKEISDWSTFAMYYLPRISLSFFIELFSFYFLRLYKSNLIDIKEYQRIMTEIDFKTLALETSIIHENIKVESIIEHYLLTNHNYVIQKDQTTIGLEKAKLESENDNKLLEKISSIPNLFNWEYLQSLSKVKEKEKEKV